MNAGLLTSVRYKHCRRPGVRRTHDVFHPLTRCEYEYNTESEAKFVKDTAISTLRLLFQRPPPSTSICELSTFASLRTLILLVAQSLVVSILFSGPSSDSKR